jgi:phosphoribosylamine-glycine ligase
LSEKNVLDAQKTNEKVALELEKQTGQKFRGFLYGGFMLTSSGVKVIEYNARLGDPEAMNVLAVLETDFIKICQSIVGGTLADLGVSFSKKATVCKYVVPEGYPENPSTNFEVFCNPENKNLYLAAVQEKDGAIFATGSRTAAFVGTNKDIAVAENLAELGVSEIGGDLFHRKDIGTSALIKGRINHMKEVLG